MEHQDLEADHLLTEADVARRLRVKRQTLQAWRTKGHGPAFIKVGASVRYSSAAVTAWLAARTVSRPATQNGVVA